MTGANANRDPDSVLAAWLDEGPRDLPDATRRAILTALPTTPQARRGLNAPWRTSHMNLISRLAAVALVAAVAVGGGLYLIASKSSDIGHSSPRPTSTPEPRSPAPSAARTGVTPQARITASHDGGLVFAFGSLWIGDQGGVQRLDPATNKTVMIPISSTIRRLWADNAKVWVSTDGGSVAIDPATNAATPSGPAGMPAAGAIWSIDANGKLHRFDQATGRETGSVSIEGAVDWEPQMTYAFGSVWVAVGDTHELVRVNPSNLKILTRVSGFSTDYSLLVSGAGFGSIWVQANAAGSSGTLYRVDPATNRIIATIPVGDPSHGSGYGGTVIAFSPDAVWTADSSPTLTRVDPSTNQVVAVRSIQLAAAEWIAFGANSLWVRNQQDVSAQRYDAGAWTGP